MKIQCPNCQKIQRAPDDSIGKRARCKFCRDTFVIVSEYTAPVIVPLPDLPDPDNIPITVDAPPPKDRSGNILARAWLGIPGPFKTSFLATLGVVSALLFAWYVVRVPKWFNRPPTPPTISATNPAIAPSTNATNADLGFLIQCSEASQRILTINLMVVASHSQSTAQRRGVLQSAVVVMKQEVSVVTELITADSQLRQLQAGVVQWAAACYNVYAYGLGLLIEPNPSSLSKASALSKLDDLLDKVAPAAQLAGALLGTQKQRFGLTPPE